MTTIYFIKYWDHTEDFNPEGIDGNVVEFFYSHQEAMQRKIELCKAIDYYGGDKADIGWTKPRQICEMKLLVNRVRQKTIHHLIEQLNNINKVIS